MGQVHTLSTHVPSAAVGIPSDFKQKKMATIQRYISILRDKEAKFYNEFFPGCSTYSEFKQRLTQVIDDVQKNNQADLRAISAMTSDNIKNWLTMAYEKNMKTVLNDSNRTSIVFKLENRQQINKKFADTLQTELSSLIGSGSGDIVVTAVSADKLQVDFGLETRALKIIVNKVLGRHFVINAPSLDRLKSEVIASDAVVSLTSGNDSFVYKVGSKLSDSPFNHDIEKIRNLPKEDVLKIERKIKTDFQNYISFGSTSPEFQKAFNLVWNRQISTTPTGAKNHFGIGGITFNGSVANIVGAFGEIQTALLGYYLKMKCGHEITPKFLSLISDPFIKGQQLKADVVIAGAGVQVKNYSSAAGGKGSTRTVDINTNLKRLESFPNLGIEITDFENYLVNSFFNTSVDKAGMSSILMALEYCLAEMASMDLDQTFSDKVMFYFLGGSYFLPASEMLNMIYLDETVKVQNVHIGAGKTEGKTDAEYRELGYTTRDKSQAPNFLEWYKHPSGVFQGPWEARGPAFSDYYAIKNSITIHASILYNSLLNLNFKIF